MYSFKLVSDGESKAIIINTGECKVRIKYLACTDCTLEERKYNVSCQ